MRELGYFLSNYLCFLVLAEMLTALQASLWLQLFGYFPAPYLWIPILNYWALHRRPVEGLIMSYLLCYVIFTMTGMPLNMLFLSVTGVFGLIFVLRDRVFWAGPVHFTISTALAAFALPLIILVGSFVFEDVAISDFHFFNWILSPLLTALFAMVLYPVFGMIDRLTHKEAPKDADAGVL